MLKIEPIYRERIGRDRKPPSYLRLKGYWLTRLGFQPGDRVELVGIPGCLVIRKRQVSSR